MLCIRILWMNHFKLRYMEYRKKKTVFLTRDKFVQRLVGNQRTAPGRTEGKPFKSSECFDLGVKFSVSFVKSNYRMNSRECNRLVKYKTLKYP